MTRAPTNRSWRVAVAAALLAAATVIGCARPAAEPVAVARFPAAMSFAVAPVLNFSGDFNLDPVRAADLLASELTYFDGAVVLPVNRVVAALAAQNKRQIESPAHAVQIAEAVGADAILVAGITEYDPYTPTVGLALQMYRVADGPLAMTAAATDDGSVHPRPVAQVQRVYDATHDSVLHAVERFAKSRTGGPNPYGWREYVKVQTQFLRFCWHDALKRAARQQTGRGDEATARTGNTERPA